MKQILCRLGKDLPWLRHFSGAQLKRLGCDHEGGEVAEAGFPDLLGISSVKEKPRGKDKAAVLPNDLVDSFNVPGSNDYKICWSK